MSVLVGAWNVPQHAVSSELARGLHDCVDCAQFMPGHMGCTREAAFFQNIIHTYIHTYMRTCIQTCIHTHMQFVI